MTTKRSWKTNPVIVPRFLQAAIRKGLKMADSIGVEEANDKSWLRIAFKKFPVKPKPRTGEALDLYPSFKAVRVALDRAQQAYECHEPYSAYRSEIAVLCANVENLESDADLNADNSVRAAHE